MRQPYLLQQLSLLVIIFLLKVPALSQVHTPRYNVPITANTKGFYEYLPQGYDTGNSTYSLIVFLHGRGELGNGDAVTLPRILANGIPKLINDGKFPVSFTVNGMAHKFIVISPQFVAWQAPSDIEAVINYAIRHYRVDVNRIYLTGLSMGGGGVWDYAGDNSYFAHRLAAVVPVCGSSYPERTKGRVIAEANLPVWATHNSGDDVVAVYKTHGYIDYINEAPAPLPAAKKTIFDVNSHNAWTKTYDPLFKEGSLNIYEWMLQYERKVLTASSNSPVCPDSILRLSAWFVEGASYSWTGPNGFTSTVREPLVTPVTTAVAGTYIVTLTKGDSTATASTSVVVNTPGTFYRDGDQDGYGTSISTVKTCRPPRGYTARSGDCNDGNEKVYPGALELCDRLDNNCNGQVDEGLIVSRYYVDKDNDGYGGVGIYIDSCAQPAGYVLNNTDCNDSDGTLYPGSLEILDGKDNNCNGKIDDNGVAGIKVNLYGGTNAYAASDWNNWNVSASLTTGYLKYANATASTVTASLSNNNSVTDNGSTYGSGMAPAEVLRYATSATTTRTLALSGLAINKSYNVELYATRNAYSGYTTVFTLGTISQSISTYKNLSNKALFTGITPDAGGKIVVNIKNVNAYSYLAGFVLTENNTITPVENALPTVNAGSDQMITLPVNSVTLNGTGADSDGGITGYAWTQASGPIQGTITPSNAPSTTITGLGQGTYVFRLTVTDDSGALASDEVTVVVNPVTTTTYKYIKVNMFGGSNTYKNAEWNNWNVKRSLKSGFLNYSNATSSAIGASLSSSTIIDNGSTYGGTMAPAQVLRYASYASTARTLTLSGLSTSKTFNLELYASRAITGNSTVFTIGSTSVTILTDYNKTNKAVFTNLKPNASGQIVVSIKNLNKNSYVNGFMLTEISTSISNISKITKVVMPVEEPTVPALKVQAYPNPFKQYATLQLQSQSNKPLQLHIVDVMGRTIEYRQGLPANSSLPVGHTYRSGIYYAEVVQDGKKATLKLVKQIP